MNGKERRKYALEYERVQARFRRRFYPAIYGAVNSVVSSFIDEIRRNGIGTAINVLTLDLINERIINPIESIYRVVGLHHANRVYREVRQHIGRKGIGERNEQWVAQIMQYLRDTFLQNAVLKTNIYLRDRLLDAVNDGIEQQLSVEEILRLIESRNIAAIQAERIVRTEVGRAANTGVKVAAESFDVEMSKEWIAFRDFRTRGRNPEDRKDHYHLDGVIVDFDSPFKDPRSGEEIEYPQAPGGSAGMVINCRCTYAVVPKRDENDMLIQRNTGVAARLRAGTE